MSQITTRKSGAFESAKVRVQRRCVPEPGGQDGSDDHEQEG